MVQATIDGLVLGAAYALVALGFVVLYKNTKFFNFAHGDYLTVGAFLTYQASVVWGLPWLLVAAFVAVATGGLGWATNLLLLPLLRQERLFTGAIATLGLGLIIRSLLVEQWRSDPLRVDPITNHSGLHIGSATVDVQSLIVIAALVAAAVVMYLVYENTIVGVMVKAVAENPSIATLMGVSVRTVVAASFAVSAMLAGLAGMLLAPEFLVSATFGYTIIFKAFIGAIIGGFGSLRGAVVGCLIVGVVELNATLVFSSDYRNVVVYGLFIAVLIARPTGLLGLQHQVKV